MIILTFNCHGGGRGEGRETDREVKRIILAVPLACFTEPHLKQTANMLAFEITFLPSLKS